MSTTDVKNGELYTGTVQAGDKLVVKAGGVSEATVVYGTETIDANGTALGSFVGTGGKLVDNGEAFLATVGAGALFTDKGIAIGSDISGIETVAKGAISSLDTVESGGVITVANGGSVVAETIAGGTLDIAAATAVATSGITFLGQGGLLEVSAGNEITTPIEGFGTGNEISISGLNVNKEATLTVTGDTVTVTDGAKSYTLDIVGASDDGLSVGVVNGVVTIECFLAGTHVATPDGARLIETLQAGDLVLTSTGEARPVRWLGRQTVATRFADPVRVAPIRIREGALGDNLPVRDLLVSPDHALMVDGLFVQAGALVNGVSILRESADMPERLVYFHVELADHALILVEGVAAETFIDNVDRLAFDNWDEHAALDATTAPMTEMPLARAKSHRQLPAALRARLLARGVAMFGGEIAAVA